VSDRWLPVSPAGRLDGYEWRVPLAEIGMTHPVVDAPPPPLPDDKPVAAPVVETGPPELQPASRTDREAAVPVVTLEVPVAPAGPKTDKPKSRPIEPLAEPIIPVVQAPDDPGPESDPYGEPIPEKTSGDGWSRFKGLFR
jgi:HemY protein